MTGIGEFFWEGTAERELRVQRCEKCGYLQFPPRAACDQCRSLDLGFAVSKGRGTIFSYTVLHGSRTMKVDAPYAVAAIQLDDGPRMYGHLVGVEPADLRIGMTVELSWPDDADDDGASSVGRVLPAFEPTGDEPLEEVSVPVAERPPLRAARTGRTPRRRAAIVGLGATEFSKNAGRSDLRLATEACAAAVADAGLRPEDIDGMATYTLQATGEDDLMRSLGVHELTFFGRSSYGSAASSTLALAAMAIESGAAESVVCFRSLRWAQIGVGAEADDTRPEAFEYQWYVPFGLAQPGSWIALRTQRKMHEHGLTSEDLGRVSVALRQHASTNPAARFYQHPITLEDHQASRWVAEPLHLLDFCLTSDGAVAFVVTSLERARDLTRPPVVISAAVQGSSSQLNQGSAILDPWGPDLRDAEICARDLWARTGLGPQDMSAAMLYDAFTPQVLDQLEVFGFCGRGEAHDFVREGNIALDGRLPVNTHGGLIGEAYIHGMNHIAEAVRQVRGQAANQLEGVEHVLVSSASMLPSSASVLSRDR
jgi:acetyl-CoA acetyltransferase/uncharacterized OB-fold protein